MNELLQSGLKGEFRLLLDKNAELIRTTREKGIVTMVLRFAILERDDALIVSLFDRLSMKRDYFALMIYNPDPEYCVHLFTRYIDAALLDSKDIRFMIENHLAFLFRYLDGKFLHDSESSGALPCDLSCLSRYSLQGCDHYIQKIVSQMEKNPKNKFQKHVPVLKKLKQMPPYNAIIDGANVLLSRNGIPRIDDLNTMLQIVRLNGCNPLVVIHKSRTDKDNESYVPGIHNILQEVPHIITPAGMNDDLFILLAYLMRIQNEQTPPQPQPQQPQQPQQSRSRVCIITRDTYTDHMDTFKKTEKNASDDFGKYLASDIVSFVNTHGQLQLCSSITQPFSHCIQIIEPHAYIPLPVQDPSHPAFTFRQIRLS
jgi:hypothetical protein